MTTALVTAGMTTYLSRRESIDSRRERSIERHELQRSYGRRVALDTLTPLFTFVSNLEKVAKHAESRPSGFAEYAQGQIYRLWEDTVRPVLVGLQVSQDDEELRTLARSIVSQVDDSIVGSTYDLEYLDEMVEDVDATAVAAASIVRTVGRLRTDSERIAEILRMG